MPAAVVRPANTKEVSEILKVCNRYKIPVTPRGAGTGLAGGAIPTHKGVVLSMERFNKILQIDELNLQATVEPGVIRKYFKTPLKRRAFSILPTLRAGLVFFGRQSRQQLRWTESREVWRYPRLCY